MNATKFLTTGRSSTMVLASLLFLCLPMTGCLMVGGYTSGGGWFLWPGSVGIIFLVLLLLFLVRRRR